MDWSQRKKRLLLREVERPPDIERVKNKNILTNGGT